MGTGTFVPERGSGRMLRAMHPERERPGIQLMAGNVRATPVA